MRVNLNVSRSKDGIIITSIIAEIFLIADDRSDVRLKKKRKEEFLGYFFENIQFSLNLIGNFSIINPRVLRFGLVRYDILFFFFTTNCLRIMRAIKFLYDDDEDQLINTRIYSHVLQYSNELY